MADLASMQIAHHEELQAQLVQVAESADDPELGHLALRLLRPSIALSPEGGEACGRTRFGGLPPLPEGTKWPSCEGRPQSLLAQLDCAALAPLLGDEWPLPRTGLLLFFYDPEFADLGVADTYVLHVPGDDPERPAPEGASVIPVLPLAAARTPSLPTSTARVLESLMADRDLLDVMDAVEPLEAVLPSVGYRLLGWHNRGMEEEDGTRPLLQLDTVEATDWGEIVNVSFWISDEDLAKGGFDRVTRFIEVA